MLGYDDVEQEKFVINTTKNWTWWHNFPATQTINNPEIYQWHAHRGVSIKDGLSSESATTIHNCIGNPFHDDAICSHGWWGIWKKDDSIYKSNGRWNYIWESFQLNMLSEYNMGPKAMGRQDKFGMDSDNKITWISEMEENMDDEQEAPQSALW